MSAKTRMNCSQMGQIIQKSLFNIFLEKHVAKDF